MADKELKFLVVDVLLYCLWRSSVPRHPLFRFDFIKALPYVGLDALYL